MKLKILISFIFLLTITSCSSLTPERKMASDTQVEVSKPRNIIFLIHGIAGTEKTFGHMHEALTKHLNDKNKNEPTYEYIVQNFVYETKNNSNDTEMFAKDFGNAINQYFLENGEIRAQDKISIIAHSQGGIVSLIWLYNALKGDDDFNPKYAPHLDSYITLGTPFWGAKVALFADAMKNMVAKLGSDMPLFGDRQLEDMSFGSQVIFNFRKAATDPSFLEMLQKVSQQVRPVNFGGAATSMKFLSPFAAGKKEYEDDSAVPLPSSRFDFLYASSIKPGYLPDEVLGSAEFKETRFSNYHVVDALHISVMPAIPLWAAIADIPAICVKKPDCKHPTFKYVLAALKHEPDSPDEKLLSKMTAYLIDLNIKLPDGDTLPAEKIKIELKSRDKHLKAASAMEFYSHGYSENISSESYRHFYFTGTATKSFIPAKKRGEGAAFKDKTITIKVSAPGYKTRFIEAVVRATYSTFIEINLEK